MLTPGFNRRGQMPLLFGTANGLAPARSDIVPSAVTENGECYPVNHALNALCLEPSDGGADSFKVTSFPITTNLVPCLSPMGTQLSHSTQSCWR
jgi:hypothetical protein